jgi:chromosome segregation ATPase
VVITEGMGVMSENPQKKQDFLEAAKHQLAQISAEFEKALEALKDTERRKQLTSSYFDMLQKGLSKAHDSVARYQEKIAPHPTTEPPKDESAPDSSATPTEPPAPPKSGPAQPAPTS